ncbi:hypothetical protein F5Y01DRAFT_284759 [Xylaria sp. FL0043]|nr:hypothetical protein F5Y01DRAFT_284759 [Xylaria sp. FL0043]
MADQLLPEEELEEEQDDGLSMDELDEDPGPYEVSQEQLRELLNSIAPEDGEDAIDFTARTESFLKSCTVDKQKLSLEDAKGKRTHKRKKAADVDSVAFEYAQRVQMSGRIAFGLWLSTQVIPHVVKSVFFDYPGPEEEKLGAMKEAKARLHGNYATWKCRVLRNLKDHVVRVMGDAESRNYARTEDITTLTSFFAGRFNADDFLEIFEPWKRVVDIRSSERSVFRWCRALYSDLCARIKLYLDWKAKALNRRPAEYVWDWEGISNRFSKIACSDIYAQQRPSKKDIKFFMSTKKQKTASKNDRAIVDVDPNNDPHVCFQISDDEVDPDESTLDQEGDGEALDETPVDPTPAARKPKPPQPRPQQPTAKAKPSSKLPVKPSPPKPPMPSKAKLPKPAQNSQKSKKHLNRRFLDPLLDSPGQEKGDKRTTNSQEEEINSSNESHDYE